MSGLMQDPCPPVKRVQKYLDGKHCMTKRRKKHDTDAEFQCHVGENVNWLACPPPLPTSTAAISITRDRLTFNPTGISAGGRSQVC